MTCVRCQLAMKELRGTHHGQRKFRCPACGRVKMQRQHGRRAASLTR